jgi:N-dimethylarginine dimethylaminohydrolase
MGDPAHFQIRQGLNPHTRTRWGRLKRVDPVKAQAQWERLKDILIQHGVRVHVLPAVEGLPGLVFPANAGFRFGVRFYLSRLNPGRSAEREVYRQFLLRLGWQVEEFPVDWPFEGEADFIPVGDPSGDPAKTVYLFTHGKVHPPKRALRWGWPPIQWRWGFRSDIRMKEYLERVVAPLEVMPLELCDPAHYHGDTVLCRFGPHGEFLLAYLEALKMEDRARLCNRFGQRIVPLSEEDGRHFAANSFQFFVERDGGKIPVLLVPDGVTSRLLLEIRSRGVVPIPVDVSEFQEKGGGSVKCMLLDLGDLF